MQLDKLKAATKFTTFTVDGVGELQVEYLPSVLALHVAALAAIPKSADACATMEIMAQTLAAVVVWWDLYDGESPVPSTLEAIKQLPVATFVAPLLLHLSRDTSGEQ